SSNLAYVSQRSENTKVPLSYPNARSLLEPLSSPQNTKSKQEQKRKKQKNSRQDAAYLTLRSTILPLAAISFTSKGMLPTAWVAQLRHGSNARITASTLFNMPSWSCFALTYFLATCVIAML